MDIYSNLPSTSSTEPSAFVRAFGTFKGQSFDQDDYWKLVYAPRHHHFTQSWAVLFDAPIEGACGVKLTDYDPYGDMGLHTKLSAIDCDLDDIELFEIVE